MAFKFMLRNGYFSEVNPYLFLAITIFLGALLFRQRAFARRAALPPGPPGDLFGDNTKDVPVLNPYKKFTEWNKTYGPVVSARLGWSRVVIVLGNTKVTRDLLEKRGENYSDRPQNFIQNIFSGGMSPSTIPYGPRWRKWKTLVHSSLSNTAALNYRDIQSLESAILMRDLMNEKDELGYEKHLRRFAASVMLCITYGQRANTLSDYVIVQHMKNEEYFVKINSSPNRYAVNSWPILLHLPRLLQWFRWEPESRFVKSSSMFMSTMNEVKKRIASNTAQKSIATHGLSKQLELGYTDRELAHAVGAPWAAGVGTTIFSVEVFLLAMLLFPDVMKKAQAEIDSVIGQSRLPNFSDWETLPYIQAVVKETTRWRVIAPIALPHATANDDYYEGLFIPKGATVYANSYAMTQDPSIFPNPDDFIPERFMKDGTESFTIPFGFGRRLCPGMHVALQSIFIIISRMLWAFDILPALDEQGRKILPNPDAFTPGLIVKPQPFKCRFVPRNETVMDVVAAEAERADTEALAWV